jgi:choline dehydrogenase
MFQLLQRDMNRLDRDRYEQDDLYQIPLHYDALRRRSSSQTYLRDTVNELNDDGSQRYPLTISTSSLATKVLFDTDLDRPRAIGVEYLSGQALYRADVRNNGIQVGIPRNVTATREVIVSGGTFNTPQILKLSGIGPRDELESFDIPVIHDLPAVGTNLQDNNEGGVVAEASQSFGNPFTLANCTLLAPGDPCLRAWESQGAGPYGIGAAAVGMLRRTSVSENADADLFYFGGAGLVFDGFFPGYSQRQSSSNSLFWSAVKMQPQNHAGTVKLRSADPQDMPEINFNYFEQGREHDLQALVEGVQFILDALNQTGPPFGPFTIVHPDPTIDIRQAVMDQTFSHHATSSCSIGAANDTVNSCVDARFRVHGVDGLRVVDASVFPRVPGAFPVLPTFMVSEKATDVILEDAGRSA